MYDLTKYSFVNAKIRAMLSYLLDVAHLNRLFEAKDAYEFLDILKGTPYKDIAEGVDKMHLWPELLEKELIKNDLHIYRKVYAMLPTKWEKNFVATLMGCFEIEEIKTVLRIWHKKVPVDLKTCILEEKINFDIDFEKILACETIEEIILLLDNTPYKQPLLSAKDNFKEKKSTFYLETALDKDYYERLFLAVGKFSSSDRKIAHRILGVEIDIENINLLIRLRKYYSLGLAAMMDVVIPGGEKINKDIVRKFYVTNGLSSVVEGVAFGPYAKVKDLVEQNTYFVETFLYEILVHEIRKTLAGFPFTIGTVLGFLILKRKETKNVVSLLYAKVLGVKTDDTLSSLSL